MTLENAPKISIIVPVYKVEKYIARCLDSIRRQTFEDFEVIMIDDGTPDGSAEIAERFVREDRRFHLYRQENCGVGAVRNRGILLAQGEYIIFVDSDDAIMENHLSALYSAAEKNDADIVCASYYCCNEEGEGLRRSQVRKKEGVFSRDQIIGCAIRDVSIRSYLWNKLWRRSLFTDNHIAFPNRWFEDSAIVPMMFYFAKTVATIEDSTYIYTCRNNSITGLTAKKCVGDYLYANNRVNEFYSEKPEYENYRFNLAILKTKVIFTAFAWVFVRIFRAKTLDYSATNLRKICRFIAGKNPEIPDKINKRSVSKRKKAKTEAESA